MVQPGLEIYRIGTGDPHSRPLACLAPHTERRLPFRGQGHIETVRQALQFALRPGDTLPVAARQPAPQRCILEPGDCLWPQQYDGGGVIE